jgi:hypothetical protein
MSQKSAVSSWIETGLAEFKRRENLSSNRQVAARIKVSPTSLSTWLTGARVPVRKVQKLAEAFFPHDGARQRQFTDALRVGASTFPSTRIDPLEALNSGAQTLDLQYISAPPISAPGTESGGFLDSILRRFTVFANLKTAEYPTVIKQSEFFRMTSSGDFKAHVIGPVLCAPARLPSLFFVNTTLRLGVTAIVRRDNPHRADLADALRLSPIDGKRAAIFRRQIGAVVAPGEVGHQYVRALGLERAQLDLVDQDDPDAFAALLGSGSKRLSAIVVDELTAGKIIRESKRDDLDLLFEPDGAPPSVPYLLGLVTSRAWTTFMSYLDFAFESFVELDKFHICDRLIELYRDLRNDCERTLARARPGSGSDGPRGNRVVASAWARRVIGLEARGPRTTLFLRSPAWDDVLQEARAQLDAKEGRPKPKGSPPRGAHRTRGR